MQVMQVANVTKDLLQVLLTTQLEMFKDKILQKSTSML